MDTSRTGQGEQTGYVGRHVTECVSLINVHLKHTGLCYLVCLYLALTATAVHSAQC